ncbi:MAG TPA: DsbA family protein [Solirubrobacteraceae bacterium]|nr:DsbA family protein [Solirubrobacteraceae bacterium]
MSTSGPEASFYFDLNSPLAYLAAERALHELPGPARWRPILAASLPGAQGFDSFRCRDEEEIFRAELQRRADELGVQPLRWPRRFPFDSTLAMCAATYAASIGRGVPFAQAAFRQAFAGGRDLEQLDNVLIAAAACEMHPNAVKAALARAAPARELHEATARAAQHGVRDVPAVTVAGRVFEGERALARAAALMPETSQHNGPARDPRADPSAAALAGRRR